MEQKYAHPDEKWIKEKINKRCAGYGWHSFDSPARINFICGKTRLEIFCLNIKLYFRWLKRKKEKK